jgi:hypothetical protein
MLESRRLMTADIFNNSILNYQETVVGNIGTPNAATIDMSSRNWTSYQIPPSDFAPMKDTVVVGNLPPAISNGSTVYGDNFKVYIQKGQVYDTQLDVQYDYAFPFMDVSQYDHQTLQHDSELKIVAPDGTTVTDVNSFGQSTKAGDGPQSADQDVAFQASQTGWYYFSVHTDRAEPSLGSDGFINQNWSLAGISYTADIRPVSLDGRSDSQLDPNHNANDAANLDFSGGGMYAWFSTLSDKTDPAIDGGQPTNGYLTFSGPTGRGFQIKGPWSESVAADGSITYTLQKVGYLESAVGEVPLPLAGGSSLVVTTAPETNGGWYGRVVSTQLAFQGMPLGKLTDVLNQFNFSTNLGGQQVSANLAGASWGIGLGQQAGAVTGAPTDNAIPYIYFGGSAPLSVTYGGMTASADAKGVGAALNVAIDPQDPMVYLDVKGLPGLTDLGFAASVNDLLPYTPQYTPNDWSGQFFGDVYFRGELDLGALTDESIPAIIDGDMMLNLDPNHIGFKQSAQKVASDFAAAVESPSASSAARFGSDLAAVSIGIDGTGSFGMSKDGFQFTIPVGGASLIWNGPTDTVFFHGWANSFNNGLPSILHTISTSTVDVMIDLQNGNFDYQIGSTFTVLGLTEAGSIEVDNSGFTFKAGLSFDTGWIGCSDISTGFELSAEVDLSLTFSSNGDVAFSFYAGASVDLEILGVDSSWSGSFSFSKSFNLASLGTSLWDDIKNGFVDDVESKFDL